MLRGFQYDRMDGETAQIGATFWDGSKLPAVYYITFCDGTWVLKD